jgi:hypothetical protein
MSIEQIDALVQAVSAWIDSTPCNRARDREALLWSRVGKVCEEAGETTAALIGATAANPRKGESATMADVERELLDVAMTALCAVAHIRQAAGEPADVTDLLARHVHEVAHRANLV